MQQVNPLNCLREGVLSGKQRWYPIDRDKSCCITLVDLVQCSEFSRTAGWDRPRRGKGRLGVPRACRSRADNFRRWSILTTKEKNFDGFASNRQVGNYPVKSKDQIDGEICCRVEYNPNWCAIPIRCIWAFSWSREGVNLTQFARLLNQAPPALGAVRSFPFMAIRLL